MKVVLIVSLLALSGCQPVHDVERMRVAAGKQVDSSELIALNSGFDSVIDGAKHGWSLHGSTHLGKRKNENR